MKRSVKSTIVIAIIACGILWVLHGSWAEITGLAMLGVFWSLIHQFSGKGN